MGVTLTQRQLAVGAAAVGLVVFLLARRGWGPEEATETARPASPLVIEPPRLLVASGADTLSLMGPAVVTYVGLDPDDDQPAPLLLQAAQEMRAALLEAEEGLRAMGVQVIAVEQPPVPLGVPPEVDAAAGPPLALGSVGVLLADPQGRLLRLDRVAGGAALVCAAARTFGRTPPPAFAPACR